MAPRKPKAADASTPAKKRAPKKATSSKSGTKSSGKKTAPKASAKKAAPKAAAKKAAPKAAPKASSRKKASSPTVTAPVREKRVRNWKRWLLFEALTWGGGAVTGVGVLGLLLWGQARKDVQEWLVTPPSDVPGAVYSAPVQVRTGLPASLPQLGGELLSAGYEHVDTVDGPGQFATSGNRIDVWTAPLELPVGSVAEQRGSVWFVDGLVDRTEPASGLTLRPSVLARVGDLQRSRTPVALDALSQWVEPAVLAMEDSRFREHQGVDPWGITRAVIANLVNDGPSQGGSTLTQQLAKNLFLTQERTLQRKVREVFFAAALEEHQDKDELLALYLSEVYLGQVGGVPIYGVEQAARAWFGVSAGRLTLGQAATIGGVISAPNSYSPIRHLDAAVERRDIALTRMAAIGAITEAQADAAKAEPLELRQTPIGPIRRAPWAVDAAIEDAEEVLGSGTLARSGVQLHTTLQPLWQRAAEQAVDEGMSELDSLYPDAAGAQVALVAVRVRDGAVLAMVGGRDYATSPFNRATQAHRQVGSVVKPLTLLAAMDADPTLTPTSTVLDEPITRRIDGKTWSPANYDGQYLGEITIRQFIEASRNMPAITLAEQVGAGRLEAHLHRLGLPGASRRPSVALGAFEATPLEAAGAYTVFPGQGTVHHPQLVTGAFDLQGDPTGGWTAESEAIASARAAALSLRVLQGVLTDGTGARAQQFGVPATAGGKTGTTDSYRDAWFVGFTDEVAVAVWVGRDRGKSLGLSGSRAALPTWARFVASTAGAERTLAPPAGVVAVPVCASSHLPARKACPVTYDEWYPQGEVPKQKCDEHGGLAEVGRVLGNLFKPRDRDEARAGDRASRTD